jgi:hypothetical protein
MFLLNNLIIVIIFCEQAAYFVSQGFRRKDKRTNMLLVCLSLFYFSIPMFAIKLANQEKKKVLLEKKCCQSAVRLNFSHKPVLFFPHSKKKWLVWVGYRSGIFDLTLVGLQVNTSIFLLFKCFLLGLKSKILCYWD